jgi:hypothetical protein
MDYLEMADDSEQELFSVNELNEICECFLGVDEDENYLENIYKQSTKSLDN